MKTGEEQSEILNQVQDDVSEKKKPFFLRFWWIFLILGLVLVGGLVFVVMQKGKQDRINQEESNRNQGGQIQEQRAVDPNKFAWPSPTAKYITAVPVDLTQIQSISKFRSCAGHIRDGYDFDKILESDSSMKHYLYPVAAFQGSEDKVKLFAPFDGTVIGLDWEKDKEGGRPHNGNGIHLSTPVDPNVMFGSGHIYFVKDFKIGDKVKAGELLGYAALYGDSDFDIDLDTPGGTSALDNREVLDSAFNHMTPTVLAEFAKYGVTPDNTKFTKEQRDADPCNYPNVSAVHQGRANNDWVTLQH